MLFFSKANKAIIHDFYNFFLSFYFFSLNIFLKPTSQGRPTDVYESENSTNVDFDATGSMDQALMALSLDELEEPLNMHEINYICPIDIFSTTRKTLKIFRKSYDQMIWR